MTTNRMLSNRRAVALFVGPGMLVYLVVVLVPVIWSTVYTFFGGSVLNGFEFVGFDNFARLWGDAAFLQATNFTIRYAVVATVGQMALGLGLALVYTFWLKRTSTLIRTLLFFPVVLPSVAVAALFVKIFAIAPQYGLVNAVLDSLSLDRFVLPWLGTGSTAFWVLVLMHCWQAMGFYGLILFAGMIDIPDEIVEAARVDGASGTRLVRHVVLPLIRPIFLVSLIFCVTNSLKVFDSIMALTAGGPGRSTTPLTVYMQSNAFTYQDYGYATTIALVLGLMVLLVSVPILRQAQKES